ncbi:unnamed protein product [Phaedon cochleariae]|uniref:HAT C-terminal dimerisation domain-containing protein n=1 Tax=Phaedon cochleariae TaxID=80249 RepID=A0A9N9SGX4_PHACE|nr:unnamed protein product [Phaedon cochleariae]
MITQFTSRFANLKEVSDDFEFLNGQFISQATLEDIKKNAADLVQKYEDNLDASEFIDEIESFKFQASDLVHNFAELDHIQTLQIIHENELEKIYPNIDIALRIFFSVPVTSASCERSFSKLKLVNSFLRSSIGQERLTDMAILSIEKETAASVDFEDEINVLF